MKVIFKNTGMIETATIELNGLTVITGENDSGKSTIGKLLFAIIKTFSPYRQEVTLAPGLVLHHQMADYMDTLKKSLGGPDFSDLAWLEPFFNELEKDALAWMPLYGTGSEAENEIKSHLAEKIKSAAFTLNQTSGFQVNLDGLFSELDQIIKKQKENTEAFNLSFKRLTYSVFGGDIANKFSIDGRYAITGINKTNTVFEISGSDDAVDIQLLQPLCFGDVTFVESPIPLDMSDNIRSSKTVTEVEEEPGAKLGQLKKNYVPESMKDFILKITEIPTLADTSSMVETIKRTIGGDFYYNRTEREFIFNKEGKTFRTAAIASGIKYLGAFRLLLQTGLLSKTSLLIIDEPETNVHPQWQIKFAQMLVQLVKEGYFIMVTSHSPYFIEALKLFSDSNLEEHQTSFYLTHRIPDAKTSHVSHVTHDISPIFEVLAEPFRVMEKIEAGLDT